MEIYGNIDCVQLDYVQCNMIECNVLDNRLHTIGWCTIRLNTTEKKSLLYTSVLPN